MSLSIENIFCSPMKINGKKTEFLESSKLVFQCHYYLRMEDFSNNAENALSLSYFYSQ